MEMCGRQTWAVMQEKVQSLGTDPRPIDPSKVIVVDGCLVVASGEHRSHEPRHMAEAQP